MEAKPYPIEKRKILAELAEDDRKEFLMFFDEIIGTERRKNLSKILPSLKKGGFIKLEMQLKQQASIFVSKLTREKEIENPDSSAWGTFEKVWTLWVQSKSQLNEILLRFDNKSDFDENHKCITPPNSELDIQCFGNLLDESLSSEIDQETIRRFYEYGYFKKDEQIENLIDKVLPHKEVEQRKRLKELPDQVDKLCQEIDVLRSRISAMEPLNELEQKLAQQLTDRLQSFEMQLQKFNQQITEVRELLETRISKTESNFAQMIDPFELRLSELELLIKSSEAKTAETQIINNIEREIVQVEERIKKEITTLEERLDTTDLTIAEIGLQPEEQNHTTTTQQIAYQALKVGERYAAAPRIACKAVQIGEQYATKLELENEYYSDEEDYLSVFGSCLRRFGVTSTQKTKDSEELAAAIHVAMKAFPSLEITDPRVINAWQLVCGNHLHITKINVEMGWIGLQDWFPDLFADECFGERLERINLEISIRKMLEIGNMSWAIHFCNYDRSFPESYLPSFLDWVSKLCKGSIKVFLTRCTGRNRCVTSEDIYEQVACLPKPKKSRSIKVQNLKPSDVLTRTQWESWCRPNLEAEQDLERHFEFLDQFRSTIENRGIQLPAKLFSEIRHYLQLSHNIMAPTRALDWALTLRLLPWIGNRREFINQVLSRSDFENSDFPNFSKD